MFYRASSTTSPVPLDPHLNLPSSYPLTSKGLLILHKIRPIRNLRVQQLCPVIEVLRMPIHTATSKCFRFPIDSLNELPPRPLVSCSRFNEQIMQIRDLLDI